MPIAGTGRFLYVLQNDILRRLDPHSGRAEAMRSVPGAGVGPGRVVADRLWLVTHRPGAGSATLRGFSLRTLVPAASIPAAGTVAFTTNARDHRLYLASATHIRVIDATTKRTIATYSVVTGSATIAAIAATPNDDRLYVSYNSGARGAIAVVDPVSGAPLCPAIRLPGGTGANGVNASRGGLWVQTGSGMSDWLEFHPAANPTHGAISPITGGGGWPVTSTTTSSVVWLGGTDSVACADPDTGHDRATAHAPRQHWNLAYLVPAAGHLYGYYQSSKAALIELTPPKACNR